MINAQHYGHAHPEAFCLMKYQADDGSEVEWIWNSRDGVTPFCVVSRSEKMMSHVQWNLDRYLSGYLALPGERIFVDLTREIALPHATAMVERAWEREPFPMKQHFSNKQDAIEQLIEDWLSNAGAPTVVNVEKT